MNFTPAYPGKKASGKTKIKDKLIGNKSKQKSLKSKNMKAVNSKVKPLEAGDSFMKEYPANRSMRDKQLADLGSDIDNDIFSNSDEFNNGEMDIDPLEEEQQWKYRK